MVKSREESTIESAMFVLNGLKGNDKLIKLDSFHEYELHNAIVLGLIIGMGEIIKEQDPKLFNLIISSLESMALR